MSLKGTVSFELVSSLSILFLEIFEKICQVYVFHYYLEVEQFENFVLPQILTEKKRGVQKRTVCNLWKLVFAKKGETLSIQKIGVLISD